MVNNAKGRFDVELTPEADNAGESVVGRMAIDKQFHGDLEGTSKGLMVMAGTAVKAPPAMLQSRKLLEHCKARRAPFICSTTES